MLCIWICTYMYKYMYMCVWMNSVTICFGIENVRSGLGGGGQWNGGWRVVGDRSRDISRAFVGLEEFPALLQAWRGL